MQGLLAGSQAKTNCMRTPLRIAKLHSRTNSSTDVTCFQHVRKERQPRRENVPGEFYVDHTCIDCDTCRWMAPHTFARVGNKSAVVNQPGAPAEQQEAMQALLACPTYSIHTTARLEHEQAAARDSFPVPVEGCNNVFHCGFHDERSFGATSYFVVRPQGNIMVDCPRYTPVLAQKLEAMGGVRYIVLSHRDDVGDHAKWAARFNAQRVLHNLEANKRQGTDAVEVKLEGEGPWQLPDGSADHEIIFTPGHTSGCITLWFTTDKALFTGDHLAYSATLGRLTIFRRHNWHSISKQIDSVRKLCVIPFLCLLPGHGRRYLFADDAERAQKMEELLREESSVAA